MPSTCRSRSPSRRLLLGATLLSLGCGEAVLEEGEWLPGGEGTNTLLFGGNSFLRPAQDLSDEHEQDFYSGNSFFNQAWVEAPASTAARDGLGPLFNARTCSGCHFRDGKGAPPEHDEGPAVGVLLRLSVPGPSGPDPHPIYGGQLQDQGIEGVPAEGHVRVRWDERSGRFDDGSPWSLAVPTWTIEQPAWGPLGDVMISPRVAPHMIGLGLLEAIPVDRLEALADPDDDDGDGISGRIQRHGDTIGRFGWKADATDVETQSAGAFLGDMGLTSRVRPVDDCTDAQPACLDAPSGGDPEVEDHLLNLVVLYSRAVAVPARRAADDPTVLQGRFLFRELGCNGCHTPSHVTGDAVLPEMSGETIWPYTDLLLHDMGPDLADGRPVGEASGSEWRTPPLWGLGLVDDVGDHTRFLHDGRARSLEEAVLWHGGEAERSRDGYLGLSADDRAALLAFLEDL